MTLPTSPLIEEVKKSIFESGCDAYLEKPIKLELLMGTLAEYLSA